MQKERRDFSDGPYRDDIGDAFRGVAAVIFDRDGSVFADPFEGSWTVQLESLNKLLNGWEAFSLNLLEGRLVLDKQLGAGTRVPGR